jgi:uncharacterized membrane protein YdbT with pleckstrin-like domain
VPISPKLLNQGERVVIDTRTHPKVLVKAVLILLVTVFLAVFLFAQLGDRVDSDGTRNVLEIVLGVLTAAALLLFVVRPFVSWWSTTYTFTDRRFIQRTGVLSREGRTIPLNRISGVDFEIGVIDRLFGCGTLVVSDASEQGRVELHDIPRVEHVQMVVAEELHRLAEGPDRRGGPHQRSDDGA